HRRQEEGRGDARREEGRRRPRQHRAAARREAGGPTVKTDRARHTLALVLVVAPLTGCAGRAAQMRTDPTARDKKGQKLSETQQKVYEARDQSSVDVTE